MGTTPESRNWRCGCGRLDATECMMCRASEGFPMDEWLTRDMARQSVVVKLGMPVDNVMARQYVYCRPCLHNGFFVESLDADTLHCMICDTAWNRLVASEHKV